MMAAGSPQGGEAAAGGGGPDGDAGLASRAAHDALMVFVGRVVFVALCEIAYCRTVLTAYSPLLDLRILAATVTTGFWPGNRYTPADVMDLLQRHGGPAADPVRQVRAPVSAPPAGKDQDHEAPAAGSGAVRR